MRRIIIAAATIVALTACGNAATNVIKTEAQSEEMTLTEALKNRHSSRSFKQDTLTNVQIMKILWAACGINRPDEKKITAPSAKNIQDIRAYVCKADGAWLYEPETESLKKVCDRDLRSAIASRQDFAKDAPVNIVLVSDQSEQEELSEKFAYVDGGYVSQNICLMCTDMGLVTCPRLTMDEEVLRKELGLGAKEILVVNHPIGYER